MKILIDNGHGKDTAGKRSPDGKLLEYAWSREIASMLVRRLNELGIDAERIVTEEKDIPLSERCRRVNKVCEKYGNKNVLLVSIHINAAASDGKWHNASGWTGWVSNNASTRSKFFAQYLYESASKRGLRGNRSVPTCCYWTGNLYILKNSNCPCVLTENLFQDNKDDVKYLMSDNGKKEIVNIHLEAIQKYIYLNT